MLMTRSEYERRREVEIAYREGFQDGFDHGNLSYKYPDVDEAWPQSQTAAALAEKGTPRPSQCFGTFWAGPYAEVVG